METKEHIQAQGKRSVWIGLAVLIGVVVLVALIGFVTLHPRPEVLTGEVYAAEYRVSGKVPGRVAAIFVEEGQQVKAGDTLIYIPSPEVDAKMEQAVAARAAAQAQNAKAKAGARKQTIEAARELYNKALAAQEVYEKSYQRTKTLYEKKVISAQKMDEVEAQYRAAVADCAAAKSQYDMALEGAQREDREAAVALVERAQGAVDEVTAYERERYLTSPANGEVVEIYPKCGELVGQGAPLMSIVDMRDVWFTFSLREDLLHGMQVGDTVEVLVPALDAEKTYLSIITGIKAMAAYATWRATKNNGQYDVKSFDVKVRPCETIAGIRPGMTTILVNHE